MPARPQDAAAKPCRECGVERPLAVFTKVNRNPDGLDIRCRDCRKVLRDARMSPIRAKRQAKVAETLPADGMKRCSDCREVKPFQMFDVSTNGLGGRSIRCKACRTERARRMRVDALEKSVIPDGSKRCSACRRVLPLESFFRYYRSKDGRQGRCKECDRAARGHEELFVDPAPSGSKTCRDCGTAKPLDAFYTDPRQQRGATGQCRECRNLADAGRRRERGISERELFDDPPGLKTCRNCRRQLATSEFRRYRRNADGLAAWCIKCHNARTLRWHQDNPAKIMVLKARRRTWDIIEEREVEERDLRRLVRRWGRRCAYCGAVLDPVTIDHVIPLVRGGNSAIGNLLPACKSCNSSKGARLLIEWKRMGPRVGL